MVYITYMSISHVDGKLGLGGYLVFEPLQLMAKDIKHQLAQLAEAVRHICVYLPPSLAVFLGGAMVLLVLKLPKVPDSKIIHQTIAQSHLYQPQQSGG